MADPGFPVGGGMDLVGGSVDSRGSYVSKILYVKTKELGPLGGVRAGRIPPRSANAVINFYEWGTTLYGSFTMVLLCFKLYISRKRA